MKEEHSEKVQSIMKQQPAFLVRWGNFVLLLLLIIGFLVAIGLGIV